LNDRLQHFRDRARQERDAAARVTSPAAARSHLELAERYEEVIRAYTRLEEGDRREA
jgi:hypothetical protein